jgi:hypothetical protein
MSFRVTSGYYVGASYLRMCIAGYRSMQGLVKDLSFYSGLIQSVKTKYGQTHTTHH